MNNPLLIFGAGGQLGQEVLAIARARGLNAIGLTRQDADITDKAEVERVIAAHKPRMVLNAAAYTAVDRAESETETAAAVNGLGAENIACGAASINVPIISISTDYVFDGSKIGAYTESDALRPLGVYGRTKAEGEARVCAANAQHVILRTSWVFGAFGANFLKTMLRLARERDVLRIVADQHGCPTSTADIAEAIFAVDRALGRAAGGKHALFGTYHFAGSGVTTWYQFAQEIVAAQATLTQCRPSVEAITTADYPTPAKRPPNSELDSSRFEAAFGYRAQDWQSRVRETIDSLLVAA